ncbi:MAG: AAA family ATPase [Deltaproteobacteria bacterium]|nr:AAA family ATPase [Deltaproteobacteria bacterium]
MPRIVQAALLENKAWLALDFDIGGAPQRSVVPYCAVTAKLAGLFDKCQLKEHDPKELDKLSALILESGREFFRLALKEKSSIWFSFENGAHVLPLETLTIDGESISKKFSVARCLPMHPPELRLSDPPEWKPPIRVLLVLGAADEDGGSVFRQELEELRAFFGTLGKNRVRVEVLDQGESDTLRVRLAGAMNGAHLVHFIGHGDSSGVKKREAPWGWAFSFRARLSAKGRCVQDKEIHLNVGHLRETREIETAPHLVFSNSCCGADYRHDPSPNRGLAADFLAAGVRHFVGCPQKLPANRSHTDFALAFYERLLVHGDSIGEAVRRARVKVSKLHPLEPAWHLYQLFGHPDRRYHLNFSDRSASPDGLPDDAPDGVAPFDSSGIRQFGCEFAEKWENNASVLEVVTFDDDEALCWLRDFCGKRKIRLLEFTPSDGFRETRFQEGGVTHETILEAKDFGGLLKAIGQKAENADELMAVFVVDRLSKAETRMLSDFSRRFRAVRNRPSNGGGAANPKRVAAIILARDVLVPPGLARQLDVLSFPAPGLGDIERLALTGFQDLARSLGPDFIRDFSFCLQGMTKAQSRLVLSMCRQVLAEWAGDADRLKEKLFRLASERKRRSLGRFLPLAFTDWRMLPDHEFISKDCEEHAKFVDWVENRVKLVPDLPERTRDALKFPRGMLVSGPPGCGKTEAVLHLARQWRLPLYRLDLNAVYPSLARPEDQVPEDGAYLARFLRALRTVENSAPNVLLLENVDRHFSVSSANPDDSGPSATSIRLLGYFLTWLQEKRDSVFVALTAANGKMVAPEISRKGRLDRVFDFDRPLSPEFRGALLKEFFRRKGILLSADHRFSGRVLDFTRNHFPADLYGMVEEALVDLFCKGAGTPDPGMVVEWIEGFVKKTSCPS